MFEPLAARASLLTYMCFATIWKEPCVLKETVAATRSYRRFDERVPVPLDLLTDWVDTARLVASSANAQPLRYQIFANPEDCLRIFPCIAWAGALPEWDGPEEGERPSAYIVISCHGASAVAERFTAWDEGIAAQTIMLRANEDGFGGCMIGSFKKASLGAICREAGGYAEGEMSPELVLALGKPVEEVHIVSPRPDGSLKYYRDDDQVHYVPKRELGEVLVSAR